jgi:hypothetical protein
MQLCCGCLSSLSICSNLFAGGHCAADTLSQQACKCVGAPVSFPFFFLLQEGTVQLIDVGACSVVHTQQAHSGAVWSLALLPDKSGFVTGSAGGLNSLSEVAIGN